MIIPVFFNTDNNFVVPTYISLFSLLYNYRGTSEIHAYIFIGNDFSDKNKFLLNSLSKKFDFIKIRIIDLKDSYNNVSLQLGHTTKASVYRLIIPRFASSLNTSQMDTCIYLDSDLVVEGNISELFNIDINGYYVAGVGAPARFRKKDTSLKDILAIPSLDKYINSGVLLFNLREINNCNGLKERLEKSGYREDFFYRDQDAINSVLYDKIKLLPLKYNVFTRDIMCNDKWFYNLYGEKNISEARNNPFILHYITSKKPWNSSSIAFSEIWWKYVKMQDNITHREYIKPFLMKNKIIAFNKILLKLKEMIKRLLKHLVFYDFIKERAKKIFNRLKK